MCDARLRTRKRLLFSRTVRTVDIQLAIHSRCFRFDYEGQKDLMSPYNAAYKKITAKKHNSGYDVNSSKNLTIKFSQPIKYVKTIKKNEKYLFFSRLITK